MKLELILKSQAELRSDLKSYLNDDAEEIDSYSQYDDALNRAIALWAGRVVIPQIYTLSLTSGTYDYALPSYIRAPFTVWFQSAYHNPDSIAEWNEYPSYTIVPDGLGGATIRLTVSPRSANASIVWYANNSTFPTVDVALTSAVGSTDTSLTMTLSGSPHVGNSGWLNLDNEWISYGSLARTSSTSYTASNLLRGMYGTVAAAHDISTTVYFGVAADDERLWQQLYDRAGSFVHMINLHKSTNEDTSRHEKLYGEMKQLADSFWQREGYLSQRKPRFTLNRAALGASAYTWN